MSIISFTTCAQLLLLSASEAGKRVLRWTNMRNYVVSTRYFLYHFFSITIIFSIP